jgi:hypothetical protein
MSFYSVYDEARQAHQNKVLVKSLVTLYLRQMMIFEQSSSLKALLGVGKTVGSA